MYEQREDTITFVRVHTIPGIFDYINFEAGIPMKKILIINYAHGKW